MKRLAAIILLLSGLVLTSCFKQPDSGTIRVEKHIVAALPVIFNGCILQPGTGILIHNKATLDSVFSASLIQNTSLLKDIDFTRYDLLAGAASYARGIFSLEHHFYLEKDLIYSYKLYVMYDLTNPSGILYYGIIVDKLPDGAHVIFNVDLITST
jgi:hypothetical protein